MLRTCAQAVLTALLALSIGGVRGQVNAVSLGKPFSGTYIPIVAIPDSEIQTVTTGYVGGPCVQGNVAMANPPANPPPTYASELIAYNATTPQDVEIPYPGATSPSKVLQLHYPNPVQSQSGALSQPISPQTYHGLTPVYEFGWNVKTTDVTPGMYLLVIAVLGTDSSNNPYVSVMTHRVYVDH